MTRPEITPDTVGLVLAVLFDDADHPVAAWCCRHDVVDATEAIVAELAQSAFSPSERELLAAALRTWALRDVSAADILRTLLDLRGVL